MDKEVTWTYKIPAFVLLPLDWLIPLKMERGGYEIARLKTESMNKGAKNIARLKGSKKVDW